MLARVTFPILKRIADLRKVWGRGLRILSQRTEAARQADEELYSAVSFAAKLMGRSICFVASVAWHGKLEAKRLAPSLNQNEALIKAI